MTEYELPVVDMRPTRWGDPAREVTLPDAVTSALAGFGVHPPRQAPVDPDTVALPEPDLDLAELRAAVGEEFVRTDAAARVRHTGGWSTPDLLRLRAGDTTGAPDAVLYPGGHDEVLAVLRVCSRRRLAVVPFAGGTSVVGGLAPRRDGYTGVVALDLHRMAGLEAFDGESRTATLLAGTRAPHAERLLAERGCTLGHFPQSYEGASIGGYAATRSAGQSSAGYGRFDEMVTGLVLATPAGTVALGTAPMSAAGPDLRQLVLGSEGTLGVITSVTVRVRPAPAERVFEGWRFESFEAGAAALRALAQDGPEPTVLRLSDEAETAVNLADPGAAGSGSPGGCLAVAGYEGGTAWVRQCREDAGAVLSAAGGAALGTGPGEAWRAGRFGAPYLRDALLDAGALVETLETATYWSGLHPLRAAVTDAVTGALGEWGTQALVLCHVSHVYETGASLYFTVVCAAADDPVAQWRAAKTAANAAIREQGATISHHHGVGTDHRATYAEEVGPLAVDALRAVKRTLDPEGVLNPGVLIDARP